MHRDSNHWGLLKSGEQGAPAQRNCTNSSISGWWGQLGVSWALPGAAVLGVGLPALCMADFPGQLNPLYCQCWISIFRQPFVPPVLAVQFRREIVLSQNAVSCHILQVFIVETLKGKPNFSQHKRQLAVTLWLCHKAYTCTRSHNVSPWSFVRFFEQENPGKLVGIQVTLQTEGQTFACGCCLQRTVLS